MKTYALAAATIGLAVTAAPAFAGDRDVRTATLEIADINLETPQGQKVLDQRINRAAKDVCRVADIRTGTRLRSPEVRDCYDKARASAKRQVATIIEDRRFGG